MNQCRGSIGYLAYYCAAVLYLLLPRLPCTGAVDCLCSDCPERVCHSLSGACFVQFSESDGVIRRGCVESASVSEICVDQSDEGIVCCYSDECNHWSTGHSREARVSDSEKNKTGMENEDSNSVSSDDTLHTLAIIAGVVGTFFMIVAVSVSLTMFYCHCCHGRRDRERTVDVECGVEPSLPTTAVCSVGPVAFQPQSIPLDSLSSSSFHPLSLLQQRHIVQHTTLEKNLQKGRFCSTYIGQWRRDKVLVKVYSEKSEGFCLRESRIHQFPLMRHNNIHCFYATDSVVSATPDSCHQRLIILQYHRHGSLHEYLQRTVLTPHHLVRFAMSIADGLAFLHSDLQEKKPSIAHRNINSESIYVKSDDTCCISDFSLAVTSTDTTYSYSSSPSASEPDLTDFRYLAPEFLADPPAPATLENLKKGDMYSYGLVLWEIARRCTVLGMVEDVCLPYSSVLQHSPVRREEMRELVVTRDQRPPVPDQWNRDETMRIILRTITECWHGNSTVRLTPLRVKKTLGKLQTQPRKYDKNGKLLSLERETADTVSREPSGVV